MPRDTYACTCPPPRVLGMPCSSTLLLYCTEILHVGGKHVRDRLTTRTHALQASASTAIIMLCARSAPIWFKSSAGLQRLFANGMQAVLKGFNYVNGQLNPSPAAWEVNSQSILGGQPVITSNLGSNAVLWVCSRTALQAYDPNAVGQLTPIFSSAKLNQAPIWSNGGEANKGVVPTAVNGTYLTALRFLLATICLVRQ